MNVGAASYEMLASMLVWQIRDPETSGSRRLVANGLPVPVDKHYIAKSSSYTMNERYIPFP